MTNQAISPLRARMIEDMTMRNFGPKTQSDYIRSVKRLTLFLGRSPDSASNEDLRRYHLHLGSTCASASSLNAAVPGLRFFFGTVLDRAGAARYLPFVRQPRKLPVILSADEVSRFLEAAPGPKHKAAFSIAYGAGLRAAEVLSLKPSDIDSDRMVIPAWSWARDARIATSCCRRACLSCCATIGRRFGPGAGCFPDRTP